VARVVPVALGAKAEGSAGVETRRFCFLGITLSFQDYFCGFSAAKAAIKTPEYNIYGWSCK
jgi:hypothetical protein